ncbi:PEP-CTERM sorting domain-containing protein [Calothrix sp. CCY 0018]|uniref:PEP-CTERM sorting domain-containing protein n=1 Tax=Calothrix sp. CCY 0018 TaxID=3103864 RepID=UPI0039C6E698
MNKDSFSNHHFRVDIVDASFTDWFGSSSSDGVLANLISPIAEAPLVNGFNNGTFDLTAFAGSTVRLAFRNVDNQGFFHAGVDNVQIQSASTASVPEPTTILGLFAVGGAGVVSRRKKQAAK